MEIQLYRDMVIALATREGVEVPDLVKDEIGGLAEEQTGQLREWLGQLLEQCGTGEEMATATVTTGRTASRKREQPGRSGGTRGVSRGKRGRLGKDSDDQGMAQ